jgi:hypothetical protein
LAEAMDRLSRDQEDNLSEGEVTHLHVGLKGTMNALFLKELADKTRRGLRGRVELGKSGGGPQSLPTHLEILHSRANDLARPAQFFQR